MNLLERLQSQGIRRVGTAKTGFRYLSAAGKKLASKEVERCRKRVLPPAWTEARIASSERAHLQAVGKDKAAWGTRRSYIYPSVLSSLERGKTVQRYFQSVEELAAHRGLGLHASEKSLLQMLESTARAASH